MRLSLSQRGVLITALAATDCSGLLPEADDMAFYLGVGGVECRAMLDDMLARKWLIGEVIDGCARYRFKGWENHQHRSDNSTERSRKFRSKKTDASVDNQTAVQRCSNVAATLLQRPRTESEEESEEESYLLPLEQEPAREEVKAIVKFDRVGSGGASAPEKDLVDRADGLGLPIDDLLAATRKAKPRSASAYFRTLCIGDLAQRAPRCSRELLSAAMSGKREAFAAVTIALLETT